MPTAKEKHRIKTLASKGKSVNTIKDKLELTKSKVYYHFKKEVGQKQKENRLELPKDDEVRGEICGVFVGDGDFHKDNNGHYRVEVYLNYKDIYWQELKRFFSEELNKIPMVFQDVEKSRKVLRYNSNALYKLFQEHLEWGDDKTYSIQLKDTTKSEKFKIGFVRGLIDTDGYREKKFRRFIYGTISRT